LHQNAFGSQALPGPAGGAIVLSRHLSHYYVRVGRGRGRKGLELGRRGRGREGKSEGWEEEGMGRGKEVDGLSPIRPPFQNPGSTLH